ncbi:MAG TPA: nitrite reductase small subunit NirD [Abditibacteriaceae bacterium]|jgi:nitrite reductase (NADH) small subunit
MWTDICEVSRIVPDTGVCALVNGQQVAVFMLATGDVFAVGNYDPFSGANVLSRGIVGDKSGVPKVASPIYKQSFSLQSGECLDDASVRIPAYAARVEAGRVQIAMP